MKLHKTLRWMLVHYKNKYEMKYMAGVLYLIQCKDCLKIYTWGDGDGIGLKRRSTRET